MTTEGSPLRLYRLVKERFSATPLSTEGARHNSGRWHPAGQGILYTSTSPELALLEQLVHLPTLPYEDLPRLVLLTLTVPDNRRVLTEADLPATWRDEAAFGDNHQLMTPWLMFPDVLAVGVPSAVVTESLNYLLHPAHALFEQIKIIESKPFVIDRRLWEKS
ncbi:RES family NAD+ phosphorylase [Nibrella viscosa]|uniref:RES family NAD+ phosphorylase n=1 Tax=Nibrella viscosa TaxID=1084524 RepID=A0ABP8KLT0_9BACT